MGHSGGMNMEEQFPSALRVDDLSSETHQGYLHLEHFDDRAGRPDEYVVMGDLRATFDCSEWRDEEQPDVPWGNYAAQKLIEARLPEDLAEKIVFDPEGATFFAYARTREAAESFMDFVKGLYESGAQATFHS